MEVLLFREGETWAVTVASGPPEDQRRIRTRHIVAGGTAEQARQHVIEEQMKIDRYSEIESVEPLVWPT